MVTTLKSISEVETGDIVRLKSGGAMMTVKSGGDKFCVCQWFSTHDELREAHFDLRLLWKPIDTIVKI